MKTNTLKFIAILTLSIVFTNCKNKAEEAETKAAKEVATAEASAIDYTANTETSVIEWTGFKPTGKHNGTIKLESGNFSVKDGRLESGTFKIDMSSIVALDIPADDEYNAKLVGHLKSDDFFDIEKYPTATFEVTGIQEKEGKTWLSGNLKLKEKTNNVTFPASMTSNGDMFTITSEVFTIDRSKWDVKYGSKSFFDNLGDKFINDDIELKISVSSKKS